MKRVGNLYQKICSIDNLFLAESKARKGKTSRRDVIVFTQDRWSNLMKLHDVLINKKYQTSKYELFTIKEPKERLIYKLPYYPDRIVHHAIMNVLEPIFVSSFISNTFNCIKNRGIHKALYKLNQSLKILKKLSIVLK